MATQQHPPPNTVSLIKRPLLKFFFIAIACCFCYFLGSYSNPSSTISTIQTHPHKCFVSNFSTPNLTSPVLDFEAHHMLPFPQQGSDTGRDFFEFCPANFTHYCPCQDPSREKNFNMTKFFHRERHCPRRHQALRCLVPMPTRYRWPFTWPKSRDYAWFSNVPFPKLSVYKKSQNWVRVEGDRLVFPGGGTSFPKGVKEYVDQIRRVVPLKSGNIRTVLDVGCGVASFGASLLDYNILTMSIAPVDIHEAQVQFALERGLPAMLGILSTYRLPYPSRSFDMAHCSRCLVPWTAYDGVYLMEIDRVLRPGGYWVLSGPPISWKSSYKGWESKAGDLKQEQINLEDLARHLCWKKIAETGPIAVWRKPTNHIHCTQKLKAWKSPHFCAETDADAGWYKEMDPCITRLPKVTDIHSISGGALKKWPERLNTAPPRIEDMVNRVANVNTFYKDNEIWTKRISYYGSVLKSLSAGRYRNIMDMNAGIGGFAAAISNLPSWVMNVVPFNAQNNTLGVIYERGLIGTYMNWCEAFSTYPRTYDLIHAHGLFSMYIDKCDILDILFEMYRILRPEGAAIIRDHIDIIVKVKGITDRMRWKSRILHSEDGPFHPEKILVVDNSGI